MADPRKSRVLVVDAEPVSRFGLIHLLNSHERLRVVAEAEALPAARELSIRHKPDLIVLDLALGDGVTFIRELKRFTPQGRAVVFTAHADALSVTRAFKAGAAGYVTRRDSVAALMSAIVGALDGERHFAPCVERVLVEQLASGGVEVRGKAECTLSDRELQVFRLLGRGLGTRAVSSELRVSVKTVETHVQRIKAKLGVANGVELHRRAVLFASEAATSAE